MNFWCLDDIPEHLRRFFRVPQIGLEASVDAFVATMVEVFAGVWRVLRDDGVCWVNLGDSYSNKPCADGSDFKDGRSNRGSRKSAGLVAGLKPKDLIGVPWRVAFAFQAAGWYLRDAVIWHKPNPMPGSQRDRCTSSYEFVFQLTKRGRYFWDMEAVKKPASTPWHGVGIDRNAVIGQQWTSNAFSDPSSASGDRIPRNVWTIPTYGFSEAHFATFPPALPEKCIKATTSDKGCCAACGAPWLRLVESERVPTRKGENTKADYEAFRAARNAGLSFGNRDPQRHVSETRTIGWSAGCKCAAEIVPCRVLDPFAGAGTTVMVARRMQRHAVGIELNPEYAAMARRRVTEDAPLLNT